MKKYWWLSFADDKGFLGAVMAEGATLDAAMIEINRRELNPGGEVNAGMINVTPDADGKIDGMPMWKLLQKGDITNPVRMHHDKTECFKSASDTSPCDGKCRQRLPAVEMLREVVALGAEQLGSVAERHKAIAKEAARLRDEFAKLHARDLSDEELQSAAAPLLKRSFALQDSVVGEGMVAMTARRLASLMEIR